MKSNMKPIEMFGLTYSRDLCDFCGTCVAVCPYDSIELSENDLIIDETCTLCKNCVYVCPIKALGVKDEE